MHESDVDKQNKELTKEPSFFESVYTVVRGIPYGQVLSYGQIAALAGKPHAARGVGWALHVNPDPETIPCHRAVFKDGSISTGFAFGGEAEHRARLEAEGVTFEDGKVDMQKHNALR
ncbi:MAG: MGMT family protein [Clostridiaceae bacterium]|jgi:methylated-DNA-protein-cysteine methyltransferase-like protein|nr:MGMT family protein [Clostridiaceae bacterium]